MSTEANSQPTLKRVLHLPALVLPVNGVLAGASGNIVGADAIHLGWGVKQIVILMNSWRIQTLIS